MTVSSITPVNNYTGNNSTTTFDFDFYIESDSELVVTLINQNGSETTLVLDQDYSINEVGNLQGSYITFPIASSSYSVLSTNEKISLALSLDIEQETEFPACENLDLPTLEKTFDYLTRLIQILNRKIERAIKIQEGSSINVDSLVRNVNIIADDVNNVNSVADDLTNIDTVKNNLTSINIVSGNSGNITTLAGISTDITNLAPVSSNITTVAGISSSLSTVAGISTDVSSVANVSSDIPTVASNATNINTCATNISAITSAPTYVAIATEKANLAKDWASKENTPVEGSLYSAKYYAQQAQQQGGTTYAVVRASKSYFDDGTLLTDAEGLADVTSYAHSTFDLSKFTVVGSPTITDDGVASGFSAINYLTCNGMLNLSTNFIINIKNISFITRLDSIGIFNATGSSNSYININQNWNDFRVNISDGTNTVNIVTSTTAVEGFYDIRLIKQGTNLTCEVYSNNTHILSKTESISTIDMTKFTSSTCIIGTSNWTGWAGTNIASIDLKQFSITVDGVPVFSGNKTGIDTYTINGNTVSVPYTLSKTGSKIVDSYYRTQVTSVYNAFGYAPYYTLNEGTNFTLPMGEIYGFIGKNDIIEYVNGTSGYRIWVKTGYCEQWGRFNVGASSSATTTFIKVFKDTNYYLNVTDGITTTHWSGSEANCYNYSMTTTDFTFQSGYGERTVNVMWKASGYLANGQY